MSIRLTAEERALLDVIASTEAPAYNVMYGHGWSGEDRSFNDYADHPRKYHEIKSGPNKGKKSSAAGRYQFLASTWDRIASRHGLSDFSPQSQDIAAVALAREDYARKTSRNLTNDLASADPATLAQIGQVLSGTWTSLPSGIEEGQDADKFVSTFSNALGAPADNVSISTAMLQSVQTVADDMSAYLSDPGLSHAEAPPLSVAPAPSPAPAPVMLEDLDLGPTLVRTNPTLVRTKRRQA